jgi:putative CocE/NonD family hydrolase
MGLNSHESPGGADGFAPTTEALRWFDYWLKDNDTGIKQELSTSRFRYYLNRGFVWKSAPTYPIPGTAYTPVYLGAKGTLSFSRPAASGSDKYLYTPLSLKGVTEMSRDLVNPFNPNSPTNDTLLNNNLTTGDQRLLTGPDTVTYISAPLDHDVEATGPITATLFAKTTASDTDFVFKLIDAYPAQLQGSGPQPGFWDLVTMGNLKGTFRSYKDRFAHQAPIPTGNVVQYDIEGKPMSYLFKKGHRVAVTIESSDSPRLLPNPNPAVVTILHTPQYPSEITLPIIGSSH